jgi:hypothetical protein
MKPVNLAAQLAAAETELACLKLMLAQVRQDRDGLRQERDGWRREAEMLGAEKLTAARLREAERLEEMVEAKRPSQRRWLSLAG